MPKLFCFGIGYVGTALARHLLAQGWEVSGTVRSKSKKAALEGQGVKVWGFNGQAMNVPLLDDLRNATHVLNTIPPDIDGDPVLRHYANFFDRAYDKWVGYLSSTSVYGDHKGEWVDENTDCAPVNENGKQRYNAELRWEDYVPDAQIFRLAGIYGPGRNVLERIANGMAQRINAPERLFSRIHVADIVQTLDRAMNAPQDGFEIYNLADRQPATTAEVIEYGCRLLGARLPPLVELDDPAVSPAMRAFYQENKRVAADKIVRRLGVELHFPTYVEGLRDCAEALAHTGLTAADSAPAAALVTAD